MKTPTARLMLLLLVAGCDSPTGPDDAGPARDAGETRADASALDAAAPPDTGVPFDAAAPPGFLSSYPLEATFPEGGAYDSVRHTFYVGSLADGSVHGIDGETGDERVFFTETAPGLWWTLGMDVDEASGRLFVCAMEDKRGGSEDPPYDGYVWVFDVLTGERIANHDLGTVSADATCTAVVVADDGSAYVCDRENPRIYRIAPDGGLSLLVEDPLLDGGVIGQNDLVLLPDQSALLSLIYLPSRLVHVRLSDGFAHDVDIDGDFFDGTPALSGADGMAWDDGSVLVAFTSQLNRVTPTLGDWSTATATTVDVPAGMTDVITTPGGAYLLNGQAVSFALGFDPDPSALVRFVGAL